MEKGLAIIEKTDTETKGFYIDQDALEFARQNAKVNKRLAEAAKDQKKADRKHRRAATAKAKRKAYTKDTIKYVASRAFITAALAAAVTADWASLYLFIPVFLFCLSTACLRLGKWLVRGGEH